MVIKRFMNFDLSDYNVFVAGGLGDMGRELVNVLWNLSQMSKSLVHQIIH